MASTATSNDDEELPIPGPDLSDFENFIETCDENDPNLSLLLDCCVTGMYATQMASIAGNRGLTQGMYLRLREHIQRGLLALARLNDHPNLAIRDIIALAAKSYQEAFLLLDPARETGRVFRRYGLKARKHTKRLFQAMVDRDYDACRLSERNVIKYLAKIDAGGSGALAGNSTLTLLQYLRCAKFHAELADTMISCENDDGNEEDSEDEGDDDDGNEEDSEDEGDDGI